MKKQGNRPTAARKVGALFAIALVLLIGYALRIDGLVSAERLHPDEALFSTFARRAALNGDWLLHGDLDKPPLAIYSMAMSMTFFAAQPRGSILHFTPQQGEFAARLPTLFASIVTASALYASALQLYGYKRRACWTAILFTASPLAISFGASAFTDGMMLCAGALAVLCASKERWGWAGFWLGAAFGAKQQGVFLLPLIAAVGWIAAINQQRKSGKRLGEPLLLSLLSFAGAAGIWVIGLVGWDVMRDQAGGFWALSAANNEVSRLIRPDEVIPRLTRWGIYLATLCGAAAVLLVPLSIFSDFLGSLRTKLVNRVWVLYVLLYAGAHWLIAFNTYDRYALPLMIPICLLLAGGVDYLYGEIVRFHKHRRTHFGESLQPTHLWIFITALGVVVGTLAWGAITAVQGHVLVGGDGGNGQRGRYAGIDAAAAYLNEKPVAAIIYEHWLGWELGFYLGEWTDKRRVYYPSPRSLAEGAAELDERGTRYFITPTGEPVGLWLEVLRQVGFSAAIERKFAQVTVYRLVPPQAPAD